MVTGAGQGLGAAIARRFVDEGARVALADVQQDTVVAVAEGLGSSAIAAAVDVRDPAAVNAWTEQTVTHFGQIDILVCAAGVLRDGRLETMSDADWDFVVDVSLRGSFNCMRAVAPKMAAREYGRIISFASISWRGNFGQANYAAAKAGVVGLTRSVAVEYGGRGITANVISPGAIETPMLMGLTEPVRARLIKSVPVKRVGLPKDISAAATFLASEESAYVTGLVMDVDGGYSIGSSLR